MAAGFLKQGKVVPKRLKGTNDDAVKKIASLVL